MKTGTHTGHMPMIGWGQVRHTRLRPAHHAFAYPTAFLMLPMRSLAMARLANAPGTQANGPNDVEASVARPLHGSPRYARDDVPRYARDDPSRVARIHPERHCEAEGRGNLDATAGPDMAGPKASASDRSPRFARDDMPRFARDDSGLGLDGGGQTLGPADTLALAINRRSWLSFHDVDHGDGRSAAQGGALAWMEDLLAREGIDDADGEIWLQTFPRVLGHTFKPVSFWYAHRADGSLSAIVAEVNNTFGERHCYLLPAPRYGQVLRSRKVFHVSPFAAVEGSYRFRFMRTERDGVQRLVARVDHDDAHGPLIETSWSGTLEPATAQALRRVAWRYPLLTLGVVARIHWHALLLWRKKVPFWHKPEPPRDFVTR